ncbi:MAG: PAS domain S-box protein, partial [Candidatus Hermodarchaeota archaeon]
MRILKDHDLFEKKASLIIEKYLNVINLLDDVIIELDINRIIKDISPQCYNLFGFHPNEMIGKDFCEFIHPDYLDRIKKDFMGKIKLKEVISIKNKVVHKDGSFVPVSLKGQLVTSNGVLKVIGIITRHKKPERDLKKQKEKEELYLDLAGVIIIALNREGKITLMNKKGYDVLEYKEGELIGKNWFELCVPENRKKEVYEAFKRLIDGELEPIEFYENPIITKNGKQKIIAWHNALLYDEDGNIIGTLSSGEDITRRKKAEEALKLSQEKLKKLNLELGQKVKALKLDDDRLNSLLKFSQMKSASKKEITKFALEECVRLTNSNVGYFHFVNEDQKTIQLYLWSKNVMKQCYTEEVAHYPIEEAGIWADAFRLRKPVIHNDYQSIPNKKGYPEGHFPVIRHMSIPVFDGEKIVAILGVGNKDDPYDQTDIRQLTLFTENMWNVLKKKEQEFAKRDKKYTKFLKNLYIINSSINTSQNLNELLNLLLNAVLKIFDCDRAFLLYPLDIEAEYWEIPMEATKPEYPGAFSIGEKLPMQPEVLQTYKRLLESSSAITYGPGEDFEWPPGKTWEQFNIKSAIMTAFYPKIGSPWQFGIHQCSHPRVWNKYEKDLFTEISHRISDSLSSWLYFQKLTESEERYRELVENLNECVAVYDAVENGSDFMFKDYNKAAEKADQITRNELLGKTICEKFPGVHEFGLL